MKLPVLTVLSFLIFAAYQTPALAQRSHEVQFQTGYFRNWGVMYYDYHEGPERRHHYEFDPVFDADLLSISWHYPLNGYVDVGLNFTWSYDASFELFQAESFLFDPEVGQGPQTGAIYAGLTDLESNYSAISIDIRVNHLIKSNKYKFYFIVSPGYQQAETFVDGPEAFETEDSGLREALIGDFVGRETHATVGLGMGVSFPLKSGVNIKILEVYDRYIFNSANSNLMSINHSLELRTGISYQFHRKR